MTFNMNTLTKDEVRELIKSGDDTHDNQIRVKKDGTLFLSQDIVAADDTDGLLFRFETFDAGNDYVGESAANDEKFINNIYKALIANWPNPKYTSIDDFNIDGNY